MAADLHHVFDQSLDCLIFAEFSLKTLTKSIDDRLGKRLSCALRQRPRQAIGSWVLDAKGIVPRLLLST
jgi:hypothetical protein